RFKSPVEADAAPKLTISQGRPAGTNGPSDLGVPAGQVTLIWDDFGSDNFYLPALPPFDLIQSDRVQGGTTTSATQSFVKTDVRSAIVSLPTGGPTTTRFQIPINISDPRFNAISHVDVRLDLVHPDLSQLEIDLIAPNGLRVPLVRNTTLYPTDVGTV